MSLYLRTRYFGIALASYLALTHCVIQPHAYAGAAIEEVLLLVFEENASQSQVMTEAATLLASTPHFSETAAQLEARAARHSINAQSLKLVQQVIKRCVDAGAKSRPEWIALSIRTPQVLVLEREPVSSVNIHAAYASCAAIDRANDRESLKNAFRSAAIGPVQGGAVVYIARLESSEVFVSDAELTNKRPRQIFTRIKEQMPLVATIVVTSGGSDGRTKAVCCNFTFDEKAWVFRSE